ncbi:MAG: heme NO-binding domain-containing protein [Verrucomicrobia bacterium]|nr:heme NO-binding domain-containing protein [Verrucomicrobiota bacterium]
MYGMVNKTVQKLIVSRHGEAAWCEIKRRAGVTVDIFISSESYPDEITYKLVGAASEFLQLPAEQVLREFGEYWVIETAQKDYGYLMTAGGRSLPEFLINLPRFHDRVALIYPNLAPPEFEVTDRTERSLRLHYISHRPGLTPFVEGLLIGLGKMFNTAARVTLERSRADGGKADVFLVEW